MPKFKITYIDPESNTEDPETKTIICDFVDTNSNGVFISALEWVNDYAYALADKGKYTIEKLT